jgi:hypothetical protein
MPAGGLLLVAARQFEDRKMKNAAQGRGLSRVISSCRAAALVVHGTKVAKGTASVGEDRFPARGRSVTANRSVRFA